MSEVSDAAGPPPTPPTPPVTGTKVTLRINFFTNFGDSIHVVGSPKALGCWSNTGALALCYTANGFWEASFVLPFTKDGSFEYSYLLKLADGTVEREGGKPRVLQYFPQAASAMLVSDTWRSARDTTNVLHASAFTDVVFRRPSRSPRAPAPPSMPEDAVAQRAVRLQMRAPRVAAGCTLGIVGSTAGLGEWDLDRLVPMDDSDFPLWRADLVLDASEGVVEYKYAIRDSATGKVVALEEGPNRSLFVGHAQGTLLVWTDEAFRFPAGDWRGAGVAVPVFSLRTADGCGVGEFLDIKLLVDWAKRTGLRLVQLLPVNDTVAKHSWTDSYPYAAISVVALHPIYLRPSTMGTLKDARFAAEYEARRKELNAKDAIDYEEVMRLKSVFFKRLYDQERDAFLADAEYQAWYARNKHWVLPYAVFSCLRDRFGTVEFNWWPRHSVYDAQAVEAMARPGAASFDDVAVHFFIQFHLHKQLLAAAQHAREQGVVLKGDLPIGIFRHSVDAWVWPHLFEMDSQAGAPPDDFSVTGQNWGFPTYKWSEMAKDGFAWWRSRLSAMAEYFDAYRIDHILGFFRIWEIPLNSVRGLLGHFNPAHPMGLEELRDHGLWFDHGRMCLPYIRAYMLPVYFGGDHCVRATGEFLDAGDAPGVFVPKARFGTQRSVAEYVAWRIREAPEQEQYYRAAQAGMEGLLEEVLLLEAPGTFGKAFSPRIALQHTWSYKELDARQRAALDSIYVHYFYHRQEGLWDAQARLKLPAITAATDMLVCGEDLGMVPHCVTPAMQALQILSLEVQRMPKSTKIKFGRPSDAPYLSVVTPSSHDTSTLRGWWEEDRAVTKAFWQDLFGRGDEPPTFCEPWVVRDLLAQHLHSPAMWAIFPIQDLVGMDGDLRRPNPHEERINVPAIAQHYWRFRFHIPLESLLHEDAFNDTLRGMIKTSGRCSDL